MRLSALVAGILMAAYLLMRPYPDDLTSPWWIAAHVCGIGAFIALAALADRIGGPGRPVTALGAALVLPYYGAETFGLAAGADPVATRMQPVALAMFGLGLLLVAVGGILLARRRPAAWPLGVLMALVLPQFYLPAYGRMAFGVAFLAAAIWLVARQSARMRREISAAAVSSARWSTGG
ncbi:hypothetical protein [Raineyella fluvialis]|uniref:Uncharacterized protein n=1 Tax=Raineyella fluvialis TaxID=2662261 RepID=A0A5Q2FFA3_9ACTN|nr:hypothetical protein [Raineyella fluvialis]QGF22956.1 hypothetical protein Rai3103_03940 [Raineyella fluvialis]